jgi:hypothetical protein
LALVLVLKLLGAGARAPKENGKTRGDLGVHSRASICLPGDACCGVLVHINYPGTRAPWACEFVSATFIDLSNRPHCIQQTSGQAS